MSLLKTANADIKGLSCILFPFFPRKPHLFARAFCSSASDVGLVFFSPFRANPDCVLWGLELLNESGEAIPPPLRIAETEE